MSSPMPTPADGFQMPKPEPGTCKGGGVRWIYGEEYRFTAAEVYRNKNGEITMKVEGWQKKGPRRYRKISEVIIVNGETTKKQLYHGMDYVDWHGSKMPAQTLKDFYEHHTEEKGRIPFSWYKTINNYRGSY